MGACLMRWHIFVIGKGEVLLDVPKLRQTVNFWVPWEMSPRKSLSKPGILQKLTF